ncbi:hypothetical protein ACP4OV_023717 [Aristida adscensionis]
MERLNADEVLVSHISVAHHTKEVPLVSIAPHIEEVSLPQVCVDPNIEEVPTPLVSVTSNIEEERVPQVHVAPNTHEVPVEHVHFDTEDVLMPLVSANLDTKESLVPQASFGLDTKEVLLVDIAPGTEEVLVQQEYVAPHTEEVLVPQVSVAPHTEEVLVPQISTSSNLEEVQLPRKSSSNLEEVQLPPKSIAPDCTTDSVGSLADPRPLASLPRTIHNRHLSEDLSSLSINDLRLNNGESSNHDQIKRKGTTYEGHTRNFSEDLSSFAVNDLFANKGEENRHSEGEVIIRHNSTERNIYKAAEIAERFIKSIDNRVLIDHGAPIESVRDAVSKFGGILDWKERRKHVQSALDKVLKDTPEYQRRAEAAEIDKSRLLMELSSVRRVIDGLKVNLEKAQTEEIQAQQDSELANIRLKEIQQGIVSKESAAAKAEIDLAKYRHASALTELKSVNNEIEQLQIEYTSLNTKRDNAKAKASESNAAWQEIEKTVEDLTLEVITLKELVTSSQAKHIIAEEQKLNTALAYQQEKANWQNELKEADEKVQKISDEKLINKGLESKLKAASSKLMNLQGEFSAYLEENLPKVANQASEAEQPLVTIRVKLAKATMELEDMKADIERAKDEVKGHWNAAATLRADLEKEKMDLVALRQKEHLASVSISSLEEELSKMTYQLNIVHERVKEAEMPVELRQATEEVEQAKAKAHLAHHEVAKARKEADRAKAEANVIHLRLEAASREILAVNASEEIAKASANALQEYNQEGEVEPQIGRGSENYVTLSLEEYNMLSKKAQDAQNLSKKRVINAVEKIREAKEAEVRSLYKLEQLTKQIDEKRSELRSAQEKATSAQNGKLAMENELRKRKAKHEQHRKSDQDITPLKSCSFDASSSTSNQRMVGPLVRAETIAATAAKDAKSRKSFFPKSIVTMFMSRKKTHLK